MRFPVFLLMKDSREVVKYLSIYAMQADLEVIDIENEEYSAWDADGVALELGTQKPVWISLEEKGADLQSLVAALRAFAASQGIELQKQPSSAAEIETSFDSIVPNKRYIKGLPKK